MSSDLIKSFTSDFDIILVIERNTGAMVVQQCKPELLDWVTESIKNGYDVYSKASSGAFLYPEDRDWVFRRTDLNYVIEALKKESTYLINYRMKGFDGKTIYYQMKYARVGDADNFDKIIVGGHDIDESEKENMRYMEEVATAHHNAIISSLADDFDYIAYIDTKAQDVRRFHASEKFAKIIDTIDPNLRPWDKLIQLFMMIVYEEDIPPFAEQMKYENIVSKFAENPKFEYAFRAVFDGDIYYYKLKIVKDVHDPVGVIIGLISFDEQVRTEIQHREQIKAREQIEKQLEMMITERTAEVQKKNKALNRINEDIIELIGDITEARDLESGEHIRRVKGFTHVLANQIMEDYPEYELTSEKVELIASASALHDIGKIAIPDAILLKPGRLTPEEFEIMKTHTTKGPELLKKAPKDWSPMYLETSMEICHYHHEKYDGKGYPFGLKGDEIPLSAQIVSIADCYDALTSRRVYKEAFSKETAVHMIMDGQCGAFSPKLLTSFKKCILAFNKLDVSAESKSIYYSPLNMVEKLANMHILLVEENEMNRMIGREMLEGEGAVVVEATSGASALEILDAVSPGVFDAVLIESKMDSLDGPSTTKIIRSYKDKWFCNIPVIALADNNDTEDIKKCYDSGMNSYIVKPVKIKDLTNEILRFTKEK